MRWLILSNPHSSILTYVIKGYIKAGSQVPRKFLDFLISKGDEIMLYIPLTSDEIQNIRGDLPSNLRVIPLPYNLGYRKVMDLIKLIFILKNTIKKWKPDILYTTSYYSIIGSLVARMYKIPQISRFYGTFLTQLFHLQIQTFSFLPKLIAEALSFKLSKDGLVITDDGTQGDEVCRKLKIDISKVLFIRNGIDKSMIRKIKMNNNKKTIRDAINLNSEDFVITNVSRLSAWKRVDLVIQSFNELIISLPQKIADKFKLLIVGDGTQREFLKKLAYALPCRKQIIFLGNRSHEETLKIMFASDLLTFFYEVSNVGNTLLEALALGKIVVARNTGDTKNFIRNGFNGFIVSKDPDNIKREFINIIHLLIHNPELAREISLNAEKFAEDNLIDINERFQIEYNWIMERVKICRGKK